MNHNPERTSRIRAESLRIRLKLNGAFGGAILVSLVPNSTRGEGRGGEGRGEVSDLFNFRFFFSIYKTKDKNIIDKNIDKQQN